MVVRLRGRNSVVCACHKNRNTFYKYVFIVFAVKQKYCENVPHNLTEKEFWTRFFQSHYFHRDRLNTGTQDIFSECAKQDEKGVWFFWYDVSTCAPSCQQSTLLHTYLSNAGLKSMVIQGVKNPLLNLLALDDNTLDEVTIGGESARIMVFILLSLFQLRSWIFAEKQGYGVCSPQPSTSVANRTVKESSNSAIIKRFNHHSAMVLAAGSRKGYREYIAPPPNFFDILKCL